MGTRGYYCYRFRGRLYVYYNHFDSYPSVLGEFLIENIPTDPEEYQEWLLRLRARFNEHAKILDQEILTLPEPGTKMRYSTVLYDYGPQRSTQPLSAWQFHIDERLECLPSYSTGPGNDLFIEWVYIFDLDREIVSIHSQSAETSFKLNAIPRQLRWAKSLEGEVDEEGDEGPAGRPVGQSYASLLTPVTALESLVAEYDSLQITKVNVRAPLGPLSREEHTSIVRVLLFSEFIGKRSSQLSHYILHCGPDDFIYREVLFAILSLASGDFGLLADQSPAMGRRDDYQVRIGSPNGPNILPYFGSGMHASNVLPGSAPDSSLYWYKGVVVLVADRLGDEDNSSKAAIATAVKFGRESGRIVFDAVVCDIRSFILVRVDDTGVLQTELIDLVNDATLSMHFGESSEESDHEPEATCHSGGTCGFGVLMNFFDVVASYTLGPFKPAKTALPNELYDKIIEMVDPDTYVKCSEVSNPFRHYVQQHIRLSQQPELDSTSELTTSYSHHMIEGVSVPPKLTIFDTVKGEKVESSLEPYDERAKSRWAPVIGHDKRQSMIIDCVISAPALACHGLPIAEDPEYQLDDPEYASFLKDGNREYSRLRTFGSDHFYIPRFASVRDVSLAWESYLRMKLMKSPATGEPLPWGFATESHQYLLPPSTGSIPLEPYSKIYRDANGKRYAAMAGMAWLKKPTDFEVTTVRQRTLEEAQEYINSKMIQEAEHRRPTKEGVLVIAFGCKTQCFKWTMLDDAADLQSMWKPLADGAVLDIGITEQREQFEELFGKMIDDLETARLLANDKKRIEAEDAVSGSVGGTKEDVD